MVHTFRGFHRVSFDGLHTVTTSAIEAISALAGRLAETAPESVTGDLAKLHQRLEEPLTVAVAGRLKAGKSTFVNALLGQRIARTDARECTRVVTWFRFGPREQVTVVDRKGRRARLALDSAGMVPDDLGMPIEEIAQVEVTLSIERLRHLQIADTPGLFSLDTGVSKKTEDVLGVDPDSHAVIAHAEAVLYVMNQTVRTTDLEVLRQFRTLSTGAGNDAAAALGVLNKIDLLDGPDPMGTGRRIAARHAEALRGEVATVIPYIGLYAEIARCGLLTESDARALEELAGLGIDERERLLSSQASFRSVPAPVTPEHRSHLWVLLRENGVRRCLETIDAGIRGSGALGRALLSDSGHHPLDAAIDDLFDSCAPALKATAGLQALTNLAWATPGEWGERARNEIEEVRALPALHLLDEYAVLARCRRGELELPEALTAELAELVRTPLQRRSDEGNGVQRWRAYANSGLRPAVEHAARVVVRSYELMALPAVPT